MPMLKLALGAILVTATAHAAVPPTMSSVKAKGITGCKAPDFSCLNVVTVDTPKPKNGQALIQVTASSVNPSDVDMVELPTAALLGTLGDDYSGVVVECPGCTKLKVGDKVWGGAGFGGGAFSDYVVSNEDGVALAPASLDLKAAGTIPVVGLTSLFSLKATGAPWTKKNTTVVITSGSGGTGFIGIQLAKQYGAAHIATACSPEHMDFVKALGADIVVDYHKHELSDFLPDDSVDVVYDNYGKEGTADKYSHAIRSGGTYLMMPHGQCFTTKSQKPPCTAQSPKEGVTYVNFDTLSHFGNTKESQDSLGEMKAMFEAGKLVAHVDQTYTRDEIREAYNRSSAGHIVGKIAVTPTASIAIV